MKLKDIKNFLNQKSIPYKTNLFSTSLTSEYKGIKFKGSSFFNGATGGNLGCTLKFYFPKPLKLGLNIKANLIDTILPYYLHKPMLAKEIDTKIAEVKYYCIDEELGKLLLTETQITSLIKDLLSMLELNKLEKKSAFSKIIDIHSLNICGFVITDEVMFLIIKKSLIVDVEKLFNLIHEISEVLQNFVATFVTVYPNQTKAYRINILQKFVYIFIILLSISIFIFTIMSIMVK